VDTSLSEAFKKVGLGQSGESPVTRPSAHADTKSSPRNAPGGNKPGQTKAPGNPGITASALPEDYVAEAEKNMRRLGREDSRNPGKYQFDITTSKIRNILSMVSDIYNDELLSSNPELSEKSKAKKKALQIRILYEAGRDEVKRGREYVKSVEEFIKETRLLDYLKQTGDNRLRFMDFAKYMEALVAYHRYLGGKDK